MEEKDLEFIDTMWEKYGWHKLTEDEIYDWWRTSKIKCSGSDLGFDNIVRAYSVVDYSNLMIKGLVVFFNKSDYFYVNNSYISYKTLNCITRTIATIVGEKGNE